MIIPNKFGGVSALINCILRVPSSTYINILFLVNNNVPT